jgi:nucleoside-triphosphatase THEP1
VLLTGDVGVGKSILVEDVLLRLSKEFGKWLHSIVRPLITDTLTRKPPNNGQWVQVRIVWVQY